MSDEEIRIERSELFAPTVDQALAQQRAGRERIVADAPSVSPLRRFLLNPLVYLPVAAVLAAFFTWRLLDPGIHDQPVVRGQVLLINAEPFDTRPGVISMTVGSNEVLVDTARVRLERGAHEPAFASVDAIKIGDHVEVVGLRAGTRLVAAAIRPTDRVEASGSIDQPTWPLLLLFPLTATLIAFGLLFSEGLTTRNWVRMVERAVLGSFLAALFSLLAFVPAGLIQLISRHVMHGEAESHANLIMITIKDVSGASFIAVTACRSAAWACIGAATGFGMNVVRSSRAQLRNSVIGGALGGALGGMFFDPIDRFVKSTIFAGSSMSRLVGLLAVGLSIGVFVALVERLARDAWLRVRTGPLAGKSFILYKTPTFLGSATESDVYLYKDAEIDPRHAAIHRVGAVYELEDLGSRMGTTVDGRKIRRRRLASGDQIIIGSTILDFEERQKRTPA